MSVAVGPHVLDGQFTPSAARVPVTSQRPQAHQ